MRYIDLLYQIAIKITKEKKEKEKKGVSIRVGIIPTVYRSKNSKLKINYVIVLLENARHRGLMYQIAINNSKPRNLNPCRYYFDRL